MVKEQQTRGIYVADQSKVELCNTSVIKRRPVPSLYYETET